MDEQKILDLIIVLGFIDVAGLGILLGIDFVVELFGEHAIISKICTKIKSGIPLFVYQIFCLGFLSVFNIAFLGCLGIGLSRGIPKYLWCGIALFIYMCVSFFALPLFIYIKKINRKTIKGGIKDETET